jgi:hypothetical protein
LYIRLLSDFDLDLRGHWETGRTYIPPTPIPLPLGAEAVVRPPNNGVIQYQVYEAITDIIAVAAFVAFRILQADIAIATIPAAAGFA